MNCLVARACPSAAPVATTMGSVGQNLISLQSTFSRQPVGIQAASTLAGQYGIALPMPAPHAAIPLDSYNEAVRVPLLKSGIRTAIDARLRLEVIKAECPVGAFHREGLEKVDLPEIATSGVLSYDTLAALYDDLRKRDCGALNGSIMQGAKRLAGLQSSIEGACRLPLTHPELRAAEVSSLNGVQARAVRCPSDLAGNEDMLKYVVVDVEGGARDIRVADSSFQHVLMLNLAAGDRIVGAGFGMYAEDFLFIDGASQGMPTDLSSVTVAPELLEKFPMIRVSDNAGMYAVFAAFNAVLRGEVVLRKMPG